MTILVPVIGVVVSASAVFGSAEWQANPAVAAADLELKRKRAYIVAMSDGNEIIFIVEDDPEGGLTARALGVSIFTEAESMPQMKEAVLDALWCHYDDEADIPHSSLCR